MWENLGRPFPGDPLLFAALHCKVIVWPVLRQSLFSLVKLVSPLSISLSCFEIEIRRRSTIVVHPNTWVILKILQVATPLCCVRIFSGPLCVLTFKTVVVVSCPPGRRVQTNHTPLKWMEIQLTYLTRRLVRFSAIVTGQGVQREGSWESFKSAHPLRCDLGRKSQRVSRYEEERRQIFLKT